MRTQYYTHARRAIKETHRTCGVGKTCGSVFETGVHYPLTNTAFARLELPALPWASPE